MKTPTLSLVLVSLVVAAADARGQPRITTQPSDQSVSLNATVQFRVVPVSSGGPVTFRWWFKDAALDPAVNPSAAKNTLLLSNVTEAAAGPYWAVVSDDNGSVLSETAQLDVDPTFNKVSDPGFLKNTTQGPWPTWVDYDGDGWLEVVVSQAYWSDPAKPMDLYENNQNGTFQRVTNTLSQTAGRWSMTAWADYDGDGDLDCLALQMQPRDPWLFLNQGNGRFTASLLDRHATANGLSAPGIVGATMDYNTDGWPDVVVGYWGDMGSPGTTRPNLLLRNLGVGRFEVVTNTPITIRGAHIENYYWVDYDEDGDLDLHATTSPTPPGDVDQLFQNQGDGTFVRVTSHPLVDRAGMDVGAAWGDYDNDGDFDVFIPYWEEPAGEFYRNLGYGDFELLPDSTELVASDHPLMAASGDYDNDGHLDLFVTANSTSGRNHLYHGNGDGTFTEFLRGSPVSPTGASGWFGQWADYDNDGFLDLLVIMWAGTAPHGLYRNNLGGIGNTNHWLKIRLQGVASSSEGIGAKVRIQAAIRGRTVWQVRQVGLQSVYPELITHLGLGDAPGASVVRIEWPSGIVQELTNVAANQTLAITEHQAYAGAPPRIQGVTPSATGCLIGIEEPAAGTRYVLEASSDLVTWTKRLARTSAGGTHEFLDTHATSQAVCFYRLVVP